MSKISTGIKAFDGLIDSLYVGDNVVWEVDAGTAHDVFILSFIRQSFEDSQKVIYVSFNRSPQSVLNDLDDLLDLGREHFVLVDGFTAGKGKSDATFLRFYDKPQSCTVVRIGNPRNIDEFTATLNEIEDSLPPGARYVFDSLTGMQDLWSDENSTYQFFTYMCPRLYDLATVAYWILEKEAHSQKFKANLRHITQDVFDLYVRRDKLYIKAVKLSGRQDREAFKPHIYTISDGDISITSLKKEPSTGLGGRLKALRIKAGMSQKELADKVDVTASFISQLENNQISPSLNSFMQICRALGANPAQFLEEEGERDLPWLFRRESAVSTLTSLGEGIKGYTIVSDERMSARGVVLPAGAVLRRHFQPLKGPEFIYVVRGVVSVTVEGRTEILYPGDSIYLKEVMPSQWKNEGGDEAELLAVW
ncbi:MAG: helix-turn-helix domain-containing protein [Alphaproteobacteria bacterium]|uniref:Helix-turn-helix domain-containing protein n=1 Tax=Candidatus Nitrobium versatile TaxID=2884831 RepID=A0A953LVB6_9BACT|nr:helix-turn-helix domain-containing protein [Candidatus Nitrobium versatile]